jgi:hypothetical protein
MIGYNTYSNLIQNPKPESENRKETKTTTATKPSK